MVISITSVEFSFGKFVNPDIFKYLNLLLLFQHLQPIQVAVQKSRQSGTCRKLA